MRLVVTEPDFGDVEIEASAAARHGVSVELRPVPPGEPLPACVLDADGLLLRFRDVGPEVVARSRWRVVGRYGIGLDNIRVPDGSPVRVFNVPDYCVQEVAAHALALLLTLLRKTRESDALVAAGGWSNWESLRPIHRLSEITLGIVGFGAIGRELARIAAPVFGRILYFDPAVGGYDSVQRADTLEALLAESQAVTLHPPLTERTRGLIGHRALGAMRPGAILVNVSRGGLIDEPALVDHLKAGRLGGVALDVLGEEPPRPGHRLASRRDVLVTNHIAWYSESALIELRAKIAERCARFLAEEAIPAAEAGR